jgi:hypothetical protein
VTSLKEIRETVAEIRATTDLDTATINDAAGLLQELHDEIGSLRARLAHVRQVRHHIGDVTPQTPTGSDFDDGRWAAYTDARTRLDEALDGVPW